MSVERDYLELCLRLGRHVEGLVDAYYGPPEIAERVDSEDLRAPADLVADAGALRESNGAPYLEAQLIGLETVARKLAGEAIPYIEEVERCYGVKPEWTPEEEFERAHEQLDEALPDDGALAERYQRWRDAPGVPAEALPKVLEAIAEELRRRTGDLLGLPQGESYELDYVTEEPWSAYNAYLGGLKSRVEVNTDVPLNGSIVVDVVAHELYPGHHTEGAWKELTLFREAGRLEESAHMIGAPQCLIAEGIAGLATETVLDDPDAYASQVLGEFGVDYDADQGRVLREVRQPLERVMGNAALLVHDRGASPEEAGDYIRRWTLATEERAARNLAFVMNPTWRSYVTTYADGYALCRDWVGGDPERFKRLLTEQLTPADLV